MGRMNRVRLAVLFLTVDVLCAASPLLAGWGPRNIKNQSPANYGTIQLTNMAEEPTASGQATLRHVTCSVYVNGLFSPPYVERRYEGTLVVKCQNLIPGATYWTLVGTFTADSKGMGTITGEVDWVDNGYSSYGFGGGVEVVRLDGDGTSTTVLSGCFDL